MRKKFKKRLLGIILTILMVVSVIPVQQVQPVKAVSAGKKVYFDARNTSWFTNDGSLPAVIFKNGTGLNQDVGDWQVMIKDSTNVWSATVPEGATYVQVVGQMVVNGLGMQEIREEKLHHALM